MASAKKDTIYVDIDDEITTIIDKVKGSPDKIVALVLPKRCASLQSTVNMKLLKKSATTAKKNVVLITSEASLLPLAGAAGFHVAKNLSSKPQVPDVPEDKELEPESISESSSSTGKKVAGAALGGAVIASAVGGSASAEAGGASALSSDDGIPEELELDDTADPTLADSTTKPKKDKKLKVPDFNNFRTRFFLAILAGILLIGGLIWALVIAPKATITLKTDTESLDQAITFTLNTATKDPDYEQALLPAELKEVKKTDSEKVPATGTKDVGEKATGTVKIFNCSQADKLSDTIRTVPAGTGVSSGSFTFITASAASVEPSSYIGSTCQKNKSATVNVTASTAGSTYNLSARSYAIAGFPTMSGDGSAMSGGTTKIAKVVSAEDIETAKQKMAGRSNTAASDELKKQLSDAGLTAIQETIVIGTPAVVTDKSAGQEAESVTVTSVTTYTMLGTKQEYLQQLLEKSITKQITNDQQKIQDNGLAAAKFKLVEKKTPSDQKLELTTVAVVGPDINEDEIKELAKGKKSGEIKDAISNRPGIKEVTVEFSPFWVSKAPKNTSKITVIQVEAGGQDQ